MRGILATILSIIVNIVHQVFSQCLVDPVEYIIVLSDLTEKVHILLDNVLVDDVEDLVMLRQPFGNGAFSRTQFTSGC